MVKKIICDNLTGVTSESFRSFQEFSGVLEMFLKLDYVFALLSVFMRGRIRNFIFYIFF